MTFQGGFVGTQTAIYILASPSGWKLFARIFPENVNRRQLFALPRDGAEVSEQMKIVFEESSDFFGRITIYDLNIEGQMALDHNNVES